jgi:hypothetical protein
MVIIIPTPPRKPGDPPPPSFNTQVRYAIAFAVAVLVIVGAAVFLGGGHLY